MGNPTEEGIKFLVGLGLMDVFLPFVFVFTIVFGVLQKTRTLGHINGKPKRNINAMFAFIVAFFFIVSMARVDILNSILQKLALVMVAIVGFALIIGMFGGELSALQKHKWIFGLIFGVVIVIFGTSLGWFKLSDFEILLTWILNPVTIVSSVFILVIWYIVRGDDTSTPTINKTTRKESKSKGPAPAEPEKKGPVSDDMLRQAMAQPSPEQFQKDEQRIEQLMQQGIINPASGQIDQTKLTPEIAKELNEIQQRRQALQQQQGL